MTAREDLEHGLSIARQPLDPVGRMIDLGHVVQQRRLLSAVLEVHLALDPRQLLQRPRSDPGRSSPPVSQQAHLQPMPMLVCLRCLALQSHRE